MLVIWHRCTTVLSYTYSTCNASNLFHRQLRAIKNKTVYTVPAMLTTGVLRHKFQDVFNIAILISFQ